MGIFENNINLIDKCISICYNRKKTTFNGCHIYYDDVKQNCYIDIYKSLLKFDNSKSSIETFVFAITENSIITQIRELNRNKRKINYLTNSLDELNNIDETTLLNSDLELKEVIYKNLTPKEIQVIKLLNEGYNTVEIGKIMGYTPPNIRSIRNKVRTKLEGLI